MIVIYSYFTEGTKIGTCTNTAFQVDRNALLYRSYSELLSIRRKLATGCCDAHTQENLGGRLQPVKGEPIAAYEFVVITRENNTRAICEGAKPSK